MPDDGGVKQINSWSDLFRIQRSQFPVNKHILSADAKRFAEGLEVVLGIVLVCRELN